MATRSASGKYPSREANTLPDATTLPPIATQAAKATGTTQRRRKANTIPTLTVIQYTGIKNVHTRGNTIHRSTTTSSAHHATAMIASLVLSRASRSEERRVGKEWR